MDYNDGKIHGWNGGECPVHPDSEARVWLRDCVGSEVSAAGYYWWKHSDSDGDIIAFQVTKPFVEPKVIWVNEYKTHVKAFYSEEEAKHFPNEGDIRIAVKYVEAKE